MATVNLTLGFTPDKWGLVVVKNPDGTLNRKFKITGTEYAAIRVQDPVQRWPNGVTQQEWENNLAVVVGKGHDVGDISSNVNGLLIKLAETVTATDVQEMYVFLPAGTFTGVPPNITLSGPISISPKNIISNMAVTPTIAGMTNGIVTVV